MVRFKDYDAASSSDSEKREEFEFVIGGVTFTAPPDHEARKMLDFLRKSASENSATIADGILAILGREIWNHIYNPRNGTPASWNAVRMLCNDLAVYYGGGIVGTPKAVLAPEPTETPQMEEETSMIGSEEISGSSSDGETSNDTELVSTDSD